MKKRKKQLAFLHYGFFFDSTEVYSNAEQFEQELANFFEARGIEAVKVPDGNNGTGITIIQLEKINPVMDFGEPDTEQTSVPVQFDNILTKARNMGKKLSSKA